jgi:hypothetical protein
MLSGSYSRTQRDEATAAAQEKACIDAGCGCYCHVPKEYNPPDGLMALLLVFLGLLLVTMVFSIRSCQREEALHPPMPYYCTGITSTGAPADCHPAVLPPDVLKQYEDHFKQK